MKSKPKKTGVCPHCGCEDNIYRVGDTPLVAVIIREGLDGVPEATVWEKGGTDNALVAKEKYYCENCNGRFDTPKLV